MSTTPAPAGDRVDPAWSARSPGRPRSLAADRAIVDATLELIAEVGPTALSVDEVAARAGVSKATIYRRFPSKDDLVVDSLATLNESLPDQLPDLPTRDLFVAMLTEWWLRYDDGLTGRLFPRVMAHARSNPRMFGCFYDKVIEPRRELFRTVARRGLERGELRSDIDVELLVTMLVAPSLYFLQVRAGGRSAAPEATASDFVDAVLQGFVA